MLPQSATRSDNVLTPKLGVGINYHWDLHHLIQKNLGLIDYIEVSPDIFCEEIWVGQERRFHLDEHKLQEALTLAQSCPVIVHGLGLSIGSASGWNSDYLVLIDEYAQRQTFYGTANTWALLSPKIKMARKIMQAYSYPCHLPKRHWNCSARVLITYALAMRCHF